MIDEKFSSAAFEACGINSQEAEKLANLLANEIQEELDKVIGIHLSKIVNQLNAMGHSLKSEYPPTPGDISFRDEWEDESGYHCKLRVGFDSTTSTGYAHLASQEEIIKKINDLEERNKELEKRTT